MSALLNKRPSAAEESAIISTPVQAIAFDETGLTGAFEIVNKGPDARTFLLELVDEDGNVLYSKKIYRNNTLSEIVLTEAPDADADYFIRYTYYDNRGKLESSITTPVTIIFS